jgi:hypothetical protein
MNKRERQCSIGEEDAGPGKQGKVNKLVVG